MRRLGGEQTLKHVSFVNFVLQVSGTGIFPEVELSWATFNQVQRLIQKTTGKT